MMLAATSYPACPVATLCQPFEIDPQPPHALVFRLSSGAFSRQSVVNIPRREMVKVGQLDVVFFWTTRFARV